MSAPPVEIASPRIAGSSRDLRGTMLLFALAGLIVLVFVLPTSDRVANVGLNSGASLIELPTLHLAARTTCLVLAGLCGLLGLLRSVGIIARYNALALSGGVACFVCALVVSAAAGHSFNLVFFLQVALESSVPLVLGALAGIIGERAGVINVAIEGQMLLGAFVGVVVGSSIGRAGGVGAALLAGGVSGLLLAVYAIRYRVDQIIIGIVLNILFLGTTNFLYDTILTQHPSLNTVSPFSSIAIPGLKEIPLVGPVLFEQGFFGYVALLLVVILTFALMRTRWGLRVRAVGEHPHAADAVGINVNRTRYINVMLGGMIAGFAGSYLSVGLIGAFNPNMTSGIGFIALGVLMVGRWRPGGALAAALIFGLAESLEQLLSTLGSSIPSNLLLTIPYVVTIVVVAMGGGRIRPPAADGLLFTKE